MPCVVRRLTPDDAKAFQEIRLEALYTHPEDFGADAAAEAALTTGEIAERLARNAVFGAERDARLVGIAGFFVFQGAKVAHKGYVWGVYLRPEARGSGAADLLMSAILAHATTQVELVQLGVAVDNDVARKLYQRHGFVEYGLEPRAYKVGGAYVADRLMALDLVTAPQPPAEVASGCDRLIP